MPPAAQAQGSPRRTPPGSLQEGALGIPPTPSPSLEGTAVFFWQALCATSCEWCTAPPSGTGQLVSVHIPVWTDVPVAEISKYSVPPGKAHPVSPTLDFTSGTNSSYTQEMGPRELTWLFWKGLSINTSGEETACSPQAEAPVCSPAQALLQETLVLTIYSLLPSVHHHLPAQRMQVNVLV